MADTVVTTDGVRDALYGAQRTQQAAAIKQTMLQGSVLTDGEYNFVPQKERTGIWQTSTKRDYVNPETLDSDENKIPVKSGHLQTHFDLGQQDGGKLYKTSMTQEDFDPKKVQKQQGYGEDRTVNWPDMAPQYSVSRNIIGHSEYNNNFLNAALPPSTPAFPRVMSSNQRQMPGHDASDTKFNRRVNVSLGSDAREFEPESSSSYRHPSESARRGGMNENYKSASEVSQNMQKLTRNSHVFRSGDYNNLRQEPGSIFTLDFCKKSNTPSTYKIQAQDGRLKLESRRGERKLQADAASQEEVEAARAMLPEMTRDYLENCRQQVLNGASEGRDDQTNAHFVLGSDEANPRSMYAKDFGKESRNVDHPKMLHPAPPGSQVLQFDPVQGRIGRTTTKDAHAGGTFTMAVQLNGQPQTQRNMAKRVNSSINLTSTDGHKSQDRMASLSHMNFVSPPNDFRPMKAQTTPKPAYNYLLTDVALPFNVNKQKFSESNNQFRGYSMDPENSRSRQLFSKEETKSRLDWGKSTHFINGYAQDSYVTEHNDLFQGKRKSDQDIPAAGTKEVISDSNFTHLTISDNTQDLKPNPNRLDAMSTNLHQKHEHLGRSLPYMPVHKASIMTNDYAPPNCRIFTPAQIMTMRKYDAMQGKAIEKTHFFHTDNTGNKNLQTTSMADYNSPEKMMTPRALTSVK